MRARWLIALWLAAAGWLWWWAGHNPLPDGYQNEFLHVGNAFDLWGALLAGDLWHLRWFMYTGYWPWGFYAVPWPAMAVLGQGRAALLVGNLVHLAVLLWGIGRLGRSVGGRWAAPLLLLCPGVFGSLVRFEPNLADIAWTAAGLAFLVRGGRSGALGWGVSLGMGLMMDRLSVGFFLVPAGLAAGLAARERWRDLALGGMVALALSVAWYREFFLRNSEELLSQAPVGEIDSAGVLHEGSSLLYYPLALVDSQAGGLLGGAMLVAVGFAALRWREATVRVLLAAAVGGVLLFTLIAKKQVFYTLPALAPLAALLSARPRLRVVGLVGGLLGWLAVGIGLPVPGGPWLPESWVFPRHVLARPPSGQHWPLAPAMSALGPTPHHVLVFSEDDDLFEGFVVLAAREAWPSAAVRGAVLDPVGTYELLDSVDGVLTVGAPGAGWPDRGRVDAQLVLDHYDLALLPPVGERVAVARFREVGRWPTENGREIVAWRRGQDVRYHLFRRNTGPRRNTR